jgi:hypothetical protein
MTNSYGMLEQARMQALIVITLGIRDGIISYIQD